MAYSDKDLRTFTQIAYTNFSDAAEILVKDSDNGNVDCTIANLESKTNPPKDGYPYNTTITDDQKQNWKIVSIHDKMHKMVFMPVLSKLHPEMLLYVLGEQKVYLILALYKMNMIWLVQIWDCSIVFVRTNRQRLKDF